MKKILIICCTIGLALLLVACSKTTTSSQSNNISNAGSTAENNSLAQNARISFDISDNSSKTYQEHVQELWNKTKVLLNEDAQKTYTDEQYINYGKEMDLAWVNLQVHISLSKPEEQKDTSDNKLGNMTGNVIGDIDKIYGQRSLGETKEKREERRKTALKYLAQTIKEYDAILANLKL